MLDGWGLLFVGTIAVATLVMAIIQVGMIVVASRLSKKVDQLTDRIEHEIMPFLASLKAIGDNAVQVSSLAVAQIERADRLFAEISSRVEQTLKAVQTLTMAREGLALVAGLRAAFAAFRGERPPARRPGAAEEEEALFIG
jgi:predicted PurR-regulated permease PerM